MLHASGYIDPECVTLANALIASTGSPWVHVFGDPM